MRNVVELELAWALIEVMKPHLTKRERDSVFVTIGAGDNVAAIQQLLGLAAAKRVPLRPRLVQLCAMWLDAYVGHEQEQRLRRLIDGFVVPTSLLASVPISTNRPRPTPEHSAPLRASHFAGRASAAS